MSNIIEYLKDKIYYILGGTVVLIIILIIIGSCSNQSGSGSYEQIENNMVNAAKRYYETRKDRLPKEEGGTIKVTTGTLIEAELLKEIKNPNNKSDSCDGYVEVTKVSDEYAYTPFLECEGYETKKLIDVIKESKLDEYGNGVYDMDGELVYRGDTVKNYVSFNEQLWRIVKVDKDGDIKLVLSKRTDGTYTWDSAYNSDKKSYVGITTDYLHTDMRKALKDYYENNFTSESKAKIKTKDLCIGKYHLEDGFSSEKECSIIKSGEKVGLLVPTDYQKASLSDKCTTLSSQECTNYNYLANDDYINTWLLNAYSDNTYEVLYLNSGFNTSRASNSKRINPVIYLVNNVKIINGKGEEKEPFIIK